MKGDFTFLKSCSNCLLSGNGLLKKKILKAGHGEATRPQRGQEVTIEIASFSEDNSSLELSKTITFIIADFDVAEVNCFAYTYCFFTDQYVFDHINTIIV